MSSEVIWNNGIKKKPKKLRGCCDFFCGLGCFLVGMVWDAFRPSVAPGWSRFPGWKDAGWFGLQLRTGDGIFLTLLGEGRVLASVGMCWGDWWC